MKTKENKLLKTILSYLIMTGGVVLMTVGVYFFKIPNGFVTGGVSGIGTVLGKVAPILSTATWITVINIVLLILGFIFVGKETGIKTAYCSLMFSGMSMVLEKIAPITEPLTNQPFLELVYAIMLTAAGSAIMFSQAASSGGTDIVALLLRKHTSFNVATSLLFTDFLIAASTFIKFGGTGISLAVETGLFSLMGLFAKVFVVDDILDSINMCKSFTIITSLPEKIEEYILKEMHHGATVYEAHGSYTGDGRTVIMTVCKRSEAIRLRKKVDEIDPHAFMIVTKTSEIMGKGFRDNVN